jgi:hypothetical protein
MVKAAEESEVENDGDSDITAIFDGSWPEPYNKGWLISPAGLAPGSRDV